MPSYDKDKLIRLLERKRAAYMTLRDFSHRALEAREALAKHQRVMLDAAAQKGGEDALRGLFRLPLAETGVVSRSQVESYEVLRGGNKYSLTTGVSWDWWTQYLALRGKAERLASEEKKHSENVQRQFAIVQPLLEAVRDWGFNNPELEVL